MMEIIYRLTPATGSPHTFKVELDSYALLRVDVATPERLRECTSKDAPVNAVVLLDLFAKALPCSVADSVTELAYLFAPPAGALPS